MSHPHVLPPGEYRMARTISDKHLVAEGLGEIRRTSFWRGSAAARVLDGRTFELSKKGAFRRTYLAHDPDGLQLGQLTMKGGFRTKGELHWGGAEYLLRRSGGFREHYQLKRSDPGVVGGPGPGVDDGVVLEIRAKGLVSNALLMTVHPGERLDPVFALFTLWATLQHLRSQQAASGSGAAGGGS